MMGRLTVEDIIERLRRYNMNKHGNHGEERDEHMERIKAQCDRDGTPYPAELIQHQVALQKRLRDRGRLNQ